MNTKTTDTRRPEPCHCYQCEGGQQHPLKAFQLYNSDTGARLGIVEAATQLGALDKFAQQHGFTNASKMWLMGKFEYVNAAEVLS